LASSNKSYAVAVGTCCSLSVYSIGSHALRAQDLAAVAPIVVITLQLQSRYYKTLIQRLLPKNANNFISMVLSHRVFPSVTSRGPYLLYSRLSLSWTGFCRMRWS